jgi:Flp pilus assembly protein TadD
MWLKQRVVASLLGLALGGALNVQASDLKITLPKRSRMTPVQRLNREGVEAVRNHKYEKAESFFYKAYLLDSDDPFTLNNLGYVSELQGQVDRAERFYKLAAEQSSDAAIDLASSDRGHSDRNSRLRGHSMNEVLSASNTPLKVNHENVEAVRLLSQGRALEVDRLLQQTLKTDPDNVFALNNMGVAKEMEGQSDQALKYYDAAAATHSSAAAVVTLNRSWRGKPVNEMAAQNARKLRRRLENRDVDSKLAELNFRGVSALNSNDLESAGQDFQSAYALDPDNAFVLNNIAYLAEIQGDRESAEYFYDKARSAPGANAVVGLATQRSAEGSTLFQVATESNSKVEGKVAQEREAHREQHNPIMLRRRDNTLVDESAPTPSTGSQPQP